MSYKKELELLKNKINNIYFEAITMKYETNFKGEQDIVTSTDLFIEREIIKAIKEEFPNDNFHTEEYHYNTSLKNRTWIIDPIDGTSNYASGLGLYVVQIAFFNQGDIVLSYIFAPELNKTYYAIKGEGAYLNGKKYLINDYIYRNSFMISLVGLTHTAEDKRYYNKLIDSGIKHKYKLRMLGSIGLELALMSEGIFDLFYTNVTNLWDLCPGVLLLREAGAVLLNEKGEVYSLKDNNLFVIKTADNIKLLEEEVFNI